MQVSLILLRCLYAQLLNTGVEAEFLRKSGFNLETLQHPYQRVDSDHAARAVRVAYELSQDRALALHAGARTAPQDLGIPGLLMAHASTLRAAIAELQRYWLLLSSHGGCILDTGPELARLILDLPTQLEAGQQVAYEFGFAFLWQLARAFVGTQAKPLYVSFPYAPPSYADEYAKLFLCDVRFGADTGELAIPPSWLDRAQALADPQLVRVLHTTAESLLAQTALAAPMHERVIALLRGRPELLGTDHNELSKLLGVSARGLRRALQREGQTLQAIADAQRMERARRLLAQNSLTIKDVASQLGYSEPSAFHRAFRRWTGESPQRYRQQHARGRPPPAGSERE